MTSYGEWLAPSSKWKPLLDRGVVGINRPANRLVWNEGPRKGEFAAALVPSQGLSDRLSGMPQVLAKVSDFVQNSTELARIASVLDATQLLSSVGAIASVANVAVSVAGFAAVMHKLKRIEGKLDDLLKKSDDQRQALLHLDAEISAFLFARLESAHAELDRAISADTSDERIESARRAGGLFREARKRFLGLWKREQPWQSPHFEIDTARELQARYVASAVGELQAEFLLRDRGTFAETVRSAVDDTRTMLPNVRDAFRSRSNELISRTLLRHNEREQAVVIASKLPGLADALQVAAAATAESMHRLEAANLDFDLPDLLGAPSHEILRAMRKPDVDVYALGRLGDVA